MGSTSKGLRPKFFVMDLLGLKLESGVASSNDPHGFRDWGQGFNDNSANPHNGTV